MRNNSSQVLLALGKINSGTPHHPGSHCQAARNKSATRALQAVVLMPEPMIYFKPTNWLVYKSLADTSLGTMALLT